MEIGKKVEDISVFLIKERITLDKYEYKVRTEEIKDLIAQKEYAKAAEIADTIDWRRVRSVMMLCTISDLYKINRRYEDSRDLLLLAYDRHPSGRTIVYALCELSVKIGDLLQAKEYYKEFVNIAPRDSGRYILQYKMYEAQNVSIEERIAVLEELKKHDYREKWAYELAYLYHRIGLESKCIEECDEMIVWFGDGKYVTRAMELKMLHCPLTPQQMEKYNQRFAPVQEEILVETQEIVTEIIQQEAEEEMIQEVAEEVRADATMTWSREDVAAAVAEAEIANAATKRIDVGEIDIQVKTMDPSQCNTINLQEEVAAGLREIMEREAEEEANSTSFDPILNTGEIYEDTKVMSVTSVMGAPEEAATADMDNTREVVEEKVPEEVLAEVVSIETQEEMPVVNTAQVPKDMAHVLSMEGDGQLSFVMPEKEIVEKQITGQLNIADFMIEWERMKKELEENGKEKIRQHVKENTGQMFTEFEASVRDGLLEQLEGGRSVESVIAQAEGYAAEEDELPVPPSLMEDDEAENIVYEETSWEEITQEELTDEDEVEELAEVIEFPESIVESEAEPIVESVTEDMEALRAEIASLSEELEDVEVSVDETYEELEEIEEAVAYIEKRERINQEAEEILEDIAEAEEIIEEEFPEEIMEELAEPEDTSEEEETSEETIDEVVIEEDADVIAEDIEVEEEDEETTVRPLSKGERELFGPYIQGKSSKEQLVHAIDNISMAAYTGNVIVTGAEGLDTLGLAKNLVREVQISDSNFSGKTAKISGESLNKREVQDVLEGLHNGALIIQKATDMNEKTVKKLYKALQQETKGIIVIMEGTKKAMNSFLEKNSVLKPCFTARIDMEALNNGALVAFAIKYAKEQEYSIDRVGELALHGVIESLQTNDHAVTIMEVKEIMDDAIYSANRKTVGHFFDIITGKRYDEEDMIIIREKDFLG